MATQKRDDRYLEPSTFEPMQVRGYGRVPQTAECHRWQSAKNMVDEDLWPRWCSQAEAHAEDDEMLSCQPRLKATMCWKGVIEASDAIQHDANAG